MALPVESTKFTEVKTELHSCSLAQVADIDNLYNGYLSARKTKRTKKAVYEFEKDLGRNLQALSDELTAGTYAPSGYREFKIYEPKERLIVAPTFRDSIVQHTVYDLVYDDFDRGFIFDSYGCRRGKGTHRASARVQKFMRSSDAESYYLQLDIRKYYYRMNHVMLRDRLARKVKDEGLLDLMMLFVSTGDRGLYVGNVLSQLYGLIYLDRLDHYIKRVLKVKKYIRYVDDFILIGLSKDQATEYKILIELYIKQHLALELSKFRKAKVKSGSNFVGYRTWQHKKLLRKRSIYRFTKALKIGNMNSIMSMLGHAKHSCNYMNMVKQLEERNAL